ncbi:MAG: DUF975 family protein [Clostridia bacterium]|nr:DUF975 family protein [Clostridia bacterium]
MKISQIKKFSRKIIKGNVKSSSKILLVFGAGLLLFSALPFAVDYFLRANPIASLPTLLGLLLLGVALFSALTTGSKAWFWFYNKKRRAVRAFYWFRPSKNIKSTGLYFTLFFKKLLWFVAFTSPGAVLLFWGVFTAMDGGVEFNLFASWMAGGTVLFITGCSFLYVFLQRYFLVPYIKVANPAMKNKEIFQKSKTLMNTHIKTVALLKLSFIPWIFLSFALVPIFYVWPYYSQSCAVMAKEIIDKRRETEKPLEKLVLPHTES